MVLLVIHGFIVDKVSPFQQHLQEIFQGLQHTDCIAIDFAVVCLTSPSIGENNVVCPFLILTFKTFFSPVMDELHCGLLLSQ
jgi:hypothetical protein